MEHKTFSFSGNKISYDVERRRKLSGELLQWLLLPPSRKSSFVSSTMTKHDNESSCSWRGSFVCLRWWNTTNLVFSSSRRKREREKLSKSADFTQSVSSGWRMKAWWLSCRWKRHSAIRSLLPPGVNRIRWDDSICQNWNRHFASANRIVIE